MVAIKYPVVYCYEVFIYIYICMKTLYTGELDLVQPIGILRMIGSSIITLVLLLTFVLIGHV